MLPGVSLRRGWKLLATSLNLFYATWDSSFPLTTRTVSVYSNFDSYLCSAIPYVRCSSPLRARYYHLLSRTRPPFMGTMGSIRVPIWRLGGCTQIRKAHCRSISNRCVFFNHPD